MRITATFIVILLVSASALSQADLRLYPVTENAKFGFADATGRIVIPTKFDHASDFHDGLAMIEVNRKKGFIDRSGAIVVEPKYDEARDFSEGLAVVSSNYRWGYINVAGDEAIPLQFIEAYSFSDGLAPVNVQSDDPKKDSQWGYIDKKGDLAISPRFFKAQQFRDGVASVLVGKFGEDNKRGLIDKSGKFIVPPVHGMSGGHSDGLIPVEFGFPSKKLGERMYQDVPGKWGYIDSTGRLVIPAKFDDADEFSEQLANVTIGKKYGYINKAGKVVIAPQFEFSSGSYRCAKFVEGRACFERAGKIGFIDATGKVVIEPQFEWVSTFSDGIAQVGFGMYPDAEKERFPIRDNYGLIDLSGKIIYRPQNRHSTTYSKNDAVDPKLYEGWRKIDEKMFSFYAPSAIQGGKQRGIDTSVFEYIGADLRISFDIGLMANPRPNGSADKSMLIDGQPAGIWHSPDRAHLHIALGNNYNKTQFNMYVFSKNPELRDLAEKLFSSLRFE